MNLRFCGLDKIVFADGDIDRVCYQAVNRKVSGFNKRAAGKPESATGAIPVAVKVIFMACRNRSGITGCHMTQMGLMGRNVIGQ